MKKLLTIISLMVTTQVFAVDIARRSDTFITVDTITNTTAGAYENFEVISFFPNIHKVVVISSTNGRYYTEFCNQIDKNSDTGCNTYDPEPIFADWDSAQADGNVTLDADLNATERKKYTAHWFYQIYAANDLNSYYKEMVDAAVLTDTEMRERYFGTCRAYEFDDTTCADLVTIRFDTGRRPRSAEMTLLKLPNRFKKMIDEMNAVIVD